MTAFADFQNEVYLKGLFGEQPTMAFGWRELQAAAEQVMTPGAVGYVSGGAGGEETMRANREAFDRWRLVPRMLRGIPAQRDLSTAVLGTAMAAPVLLAPVGVLSIVHADAERAVARAAAALGLAMVVSTASSTSMEDLQTELAGSPAWYQLYWPKDRDVAASLVARAQAGGYTALVVTLDTWQLGWRPAVPARGGDRQLRVRSGVSGRPRRDARSGSERRGAAFPGDVQQRGADLGRPGLAAVPDDPADRAQGAATPR